MLEINKKGKFIDMNFLKQLENPKPLSKTHFPIRHDKAVSLIEKQIHDYDYTITDRTFALSSDNNRFFGVIKINNIKCERDDYQLTIGIRHANDCSSSFKVGLGSNVYVCNNMAFIADHAISHKHTLNMLENLPVLIKGMMNDVFMKTSRLHIRYQKYKKCSIGNIWADHIIMESIRRCIISKSKASKVDSEWRNPSYKDFEKRDSWSLFNCFTNEFKDLNLENSIIKTTKLHNLFDQVVGYNKCDY